MFPLEATAARSARNDAFVPQFRCASAGIELNFNHGNRDLSPHEYAPGMTQPHHVSKPIEDGMARSLLPLDGARRFACDVEHDAIYLIHLVGDAGTDLFHDLVREPAPVGGHRILAGHRT